MSCVREPTTSCWVAAQQHWAEPGIPATCCSFQLSVPRIWGECYRSIVSSAWMMRDLASRSSVISLRIEKGIGNIQRAHAHEKVNVRRET